MRDFLVNCLIRTSLAAAVVSGIFSLAALVGFCMPGADADARRIFRRLGGYSLPAFLVTTAIFWWASKGATIPI